MNRHEEYQDCKTEYPEHKKIYPEYRTQENREEKDSILKIEEENTNQTDLGTQSSDAN